MHAMRIVLMSALVALGFVAWSPDAYAQGTCRCNNGCHAIPSQCVQGSGCEPGYAPFCGNRASTCPHMGWVSCSGDCTCVPIPGYDAGMTPVDSGPGGGDASFTDARTGEDAPSATDAFSSADGPAGATDGAQAPDAPGPDSTPGTDGSSAGSDGSTPGTDSSSAGSDGSTPAMDGSSGTPPGGTVPCPDGVVVDGVCYNQHCVYEYELNWQCVDPGQRCRLFQGVPFCVPVCADATCGEGEYCDPNNGCTKGQPACDQADAARCPAGEYCDPTAGCVSDRCFSGELTCGPGMVCEHSRCVAGAPDGGRGDGGRVRGGQGGCGCRAAGTQGPGGVALVALGLAALAVGSRSRSRRRASARAR
jgi:MYXO-CTERM domain-containing protein